MTAFYNNLSLNTLSFSSVGSFIFSGALIVTALISLVLYYHWLRYATGVISTFGAFAIYTAGVAGLLLCMAIALAQLT